jgi:hypothetical protein
MKLNGRRNGRPARRSTTPLAEITHSANDGFAPEAASRKSNNGEFSFHSEADIAC